METKKKRILILGGTGMLGQETVRYFTESGRYEVCHTSRRPDAAANGALYFDALTSPVEELPGGMDYALNCIGVIKPYMEKEPENAILLNAYFPWKLAGWCERHGTKLIHISTDCVYSGRDGRYTESSPHDALDAYGKTKSLGECSAKAMVLRTSIIGEETSHFVSLVEWSKSMRGQRVQGYTTHLWNGLTTREYAKCCDKIMTNSWFEKGLYHIHAKDDVTKCTMLRYFDEKFDLGLTIEEARPEGCDRTLRSEKELCAKLDIPTVKQMVSEM